MPGLPMTWNVIVANVSIPFAGAKVGLFAANLTVPLAAARVPIFIIGTSKSGDPCVILVTITTWGSNVSSNRYESTFVAPVFTTTGTEKLVPDCTGPAGETIRAVPGSTSTDSGSTVQSTGGTGSSHAIRHRHGHIIRTARGSAVGNRPTDDRCGWRDDVETQPWRQVGGAEAERVTFDIARDDIERHCCPFLRALIPWRRQDWGIIHWEHYDRN